MTITAVIPAFESAGALRRHDAGRREQGFYGREQMGSGVGRWTGETAVVIPPQVARGPDAAALVVRLSAPRPAGVAPVVSRIQIDGALIGLTPPLSSEFQTVEFTLPRATLDRLASAPARMTLRAPTFVPDAFGGGGDTRPLGVAVDWIRLEAR